MIMVGISTISRDLRTTVWEGVIPPISKAATSSILSAPAYSMFLESKGEVEITYKTGLVLFIFMMINMILMTF